MQCDHGTKVPVYFAVTWHRPTTNNIGAMGACVWPTLIRVAVTGEWRRA